MDKVVDKDLQEQGRSLIKKGMAERSVAAENISVYLLDNNKLTEQKIGCKQLQQSIEHILSGLVQYYGEEYRRSRLVKYNAQLLLDIAAKNTELREVTDILSQLTQRLASTLFNWSCADKYIEIMSPDTDIEYADELSDRLSQFIARHNYLQV